MSKSAAEVEAQTEAQGYVLGAAEGEHLVHYRNPGNIIIKVDPVKGSKNVAWGTQQVPIGAGIPIHRHFDSDEAFYILDGGGTFILNDVRHPFEKGGTIFIPKNSWHGSRTRTVSCCCFGLSRPPALMRSSAKPAIRPGVPPKQLTREQVNQIARKYGTEYQLLGPRRHEPVVGTKRTCRAHLTMSVWVERKSALRRQTDANDPFRTSARLRFNEYYALYTSASGQFNACSIGG